MLTSDRTHFSRQRRRVCLGTSGAHWQSFKLDVMGEGDNIRLVPGKLGDERQTLERWGAGKGLQSLNCAGAHLQSYRDEPETPKVRGSNREILGRYLKIIKGCTSRKAALLTAS